MKYTLGGLLLVPALVLGQGAPPSTPPAAPAMPGPPIRRIESATHVSAEPLGAISTVRQLSGGRVLVNDGTRRRLLMFDSTLKHVTVVLDSASDTENAYGTALGGLIPYRGDSSLFIDRGSYAMLVLDGDGKIVRVRAVPTTTYLSNLTSGNTIPGVDAAGRLVLRIAAKAPPPPPNLPATAMYFPPTPDSAFIVRMDLNTRKLDTAGVVRIPKSMTLMTQKPDGSISGRSMINPFPTTDEWTVLSDGTIAIVRGLDYRVEWQDEHRAKTSSPKLPFDWVRLSDDDKARIADSVKKFQADLQANRFYFEMLGWVNMYGQQYPKGFTIPPDLVLPPGLPANWTLPPGFSLPVGYERGPPQVSPFVTAVPAAAPATGSSPTAGRGAPPAATPPAASGAASAPQRGVETKPSVPAPAAPLAVMAGISSIPPIPTPTTTAAIAVASVMPPEEWPDYKPPFSTSAVRADGDGNLWIRINLMRPVPGGPVYDLVNRKGELFDRIQLPTGHTLVGFGAGRVVYLSVRDATGLHLERVRLK